MTEENKTLAGMGAEVGFEADGLMAPARPSGFFSLVFGLIGAFAFMGTPMLVFPVLAIVLGAFALRKSEGRPPLGTGAAKVGLLLGVGLGVFGVAVPQLKIHTLSSQAERFSREYLNLVASGQDPLAMELQKNYRVRLPSTSSPTDFYNADEKRRMQVIAFHQLALNADIRRFGEDAEWVLDRPIQVDYQFGKEQVEVIWRAPDGVVKIQCFLDFTFDPDGVGQWHVARVQFYRDRVVAERVL